MRIPQRHACKHLHTDLGQWLTLRRASTNPVQPASCPLPFYNHHNALLICVPISPGMENDYLYVGVWKGKRVRGT